MDHAGRIQQLKEVESSLNKDMGKIDKEIKLLQKKKLKIGKRISHNMRYRNRLINEQHDRSTL